MSQSPYHAPEAEGQVMLHTLSEAGRFNQWMYDTVRPYCKGRVIEVGSGIGNLSAFFVRDGWPITLSDMNEAYCDVLKNRFEGHACVEAVMQLDLVHPDFEQQYAAQLGQYDSLVVLNVIEHIADDHQAISNCHKLLRNKGRLVVLVPAIPALFNSFDQALQHYRRYTRAGLGQLLDQEGFKLVQDQYFNGMGILGWYIFGRLLGHKTIPRAALQCYDWLVPVARWLDKFTVRFKGLSVLAIGQKINPCLNP